MNRREKMVRARQLNRMMDEIQLRVWYTFDRLTMGKKVVPSQIDAMLEDISSLETTLKDMRRFAKQFK